VVDQLAEEFAGQPVVFLEHDVDAPQGDRISRWWAAWGPGSATLPLVMVDSGNHISSGSVNFHDVYSSMVETAMTRPPMARLTVESERHNWMYTFQVTIRNLSETSLGPTNEATLHAIIYEEAHVADTDRWVRAATSTPIPLLEPGEETTLSMELAVTGVQDYLKVHSVVLADYRPGGSSGRYDMLQAAHQQ